MKTFETVLLITAFFAAFLGILHLEPLILSIILGLSGAIYLFAGWFLLLPGKGNTANRVVPFFVSYLIAQTMIALIFGINDWPLKEALSYITIIMIVFCIVIVLIMRKNLINKYPINRYILRLVICFMFAGAPLWM